MRRNRGETKIWPCWPVPGCSKHEPTYVVMWEANMRVGHQGQAAASAPPAQQQGVTPDKWLFEPSYGLPIVRRYLRCAPHHWDHTCTHLVQMGLCSHRDTCDGVLKPLMHASRYTELLKEIRLGNVARVAFFDNDDIAENRSEFQPVEGPCLVVYHDKRVAHSYLPRYDYRIPCVTALLRSDRQDCSDGVQLRPCA